MHPIALWLLSQVGAKLFNSATDALARNIGLRENPLTESRAKPLLDDYSQRLEDALRRVTDRIDLVYLIKLKSAIDQLKRSSKTVSKQGTLQDALNKFSEITNL